VFTLTEQGEEVIKSLNSNFGVIAVAGMYRTGKSYLLNRMLLNRQKGFSVGPTVNPCTKGLWIWSKPIYGTTEDGSRLPVLLIDTEGFGAFDEDQNHDIRIFTLAILLSSYFVFNSLGSIDENAIQSLSFVINLSKHLQMKSNSHYSETDPEELANLFPSFLWVLRDFALQLVDENGEQITSKEYLEKVFDTSKAFFEQDQKIVIRKLIKTYFKDRDCFTMVRPLMKEKDLQSLENLGAEKLRPEFLEQILQLRKKILGRVRVKTFKGKPLNGEMYLNIIKSVINSMNSGKVPSIDSTWNNMCKIESYKAFEEAQREYEKFVKDQLDNTNGINEVMLKKIHSEAKIKSFETFDKKALGDASKEFFTQLKLKLKEKFSYYSKITEEDTKNNILKILQKWFSVIEYKIQSGEHKHVDDIEADFNQLENKLVSTFPNFSMRAEMFNDFKSKVLNFAGDFFINKINTELLYLKSENSQVVDRLNFQLSEMKTNYEKDLGKKSTNLDSIKQENVELKEQIKSVRENLAIVEKEKEMMNKNLTSMMERQKQEYESKLNAVNQKSQILEEKQKEAERKLITTQGEAERERALLEQKIDHYSKLIEDYAKREKESGMELKSHVKEQSNAMKESSQKFEIQIRNLNELNDDLKEKLIDLESLLANKEHLFEAERIRADDLQLKFNIEIKDSNDKISSLRKQLADEKSKSSEELTAKENDFNNKISYMKLQQDEMDLKRKNLEESIKNQLQKLEKDHAILKQTNEFLVIQNKELTSQMEEQRKNHDNIISSLETKTFSMVGHEEFQKKVDEIKSYFENEKKQIEDANEKTKNMYNSKIDKLTEQLNASDFKGKVAVEELEQKINEMKNANDKLSKDYIILQNERKHLLDSFQNTSESSQSKIKLIKDDFERKIEENERFHHNEISELNRISEETVSQLKALFETEKIRFEEKLKDEKSKNEKKTKVLKEEYESKVRDIETELKEEIENYQNDYNDLENTHQTYIANAEHEIATLNQQREALESYLREAKEVMNKQQQQSSTSIEQITEGFNKERKDFFTKIETISVENANKDKEISQLQLKRDQLERTIVDKDNLANQIRKESEEERKDIQSKLDGYKQKYQESNDDFMVKKLEFTRESALLKQQIEFLNKKIDELHKSNEDGANKYEDRLFRLRADIEKDLNDKFERIKKEKEDLESKLIAKKKELRDAEQTFVKQSNLIEKEKQNLADKLNQMEEEKKEILENAEKEIKQLSNNLYSIKQESSSAKDELNINKDNLKKRISTIEMEFQEKTSNYEKELILWDGKFKFVEQQRDNYKKELSETQKRFEQLLENVQKKGSLEKEKLETQHQAVLAQLEQKYQNNLKEMQDSNQKLLDEKQTSHKELDKELKALNLQLEVTKSKVIDPSSTNKKLEELLDEKEKLRKEIEEIKRDREAKLLELQRSSDKEKEQIKSKITESENRLREVEAKRGAMLLEYEKDKAKWSLEKDHFNSKSVELAEIVEKLEKKIENLLRENEKLKSDKVNLKRSTSRMTMVGPMSSGTNPPNGNLNNTTFFNNMKDKEIGQFNMPKMFNPNPPVSTTNPYQKEMNKLLDNIDNLNSSRINIDDKSFEKYDSTKFDKYDNKFEKYENPYNKYTNHKYSIKPTSLISSKDFSLNLNTSGSNTINKFFKEEDMASSETKDSKN